MNSNRCRRVWLSRARSTTIVWSPESEVWSPLSDFRLNDFRLSTLNLGGGAIATGFRGRGRPDFRRGPVIRINERIRVPQVRVVGDDGEQFGLMETRDAIRRAREQGMDLVEVAPNAEPPVCKIVDFGKFQYEQKKKANEAKKKQVIITVKIGRASCRERV